MVFSAFLRKLFNPLSGPSSQKGQAVTEYLLILVIIVSIALGVVYQLNGAFKKYVESYFGDYVACLLETGELPSLGGGDGASSEGCNSTFQKFSLQNGRPLMASASSKSNTPPPPTTPYKSNNDSSISGPSSGSPIGERAMPNSGAVIAVKASGDNSSMSGHGDDSSSSGDITLKSGHQNIDGKFYVAKDDEESKKNNEQATRKLDVRNSKWSEQRKLAYDPRKNQKNTEMEDKDSGFSIGDYLRYILIAAIIITIIVVIGGQLMQARRNQQAE